MVRKVRLDNMSSRDAILGRIRTALVEHPEPDRPLPLVAEVWPRLNPPVEQMVERFTKELEAARRGDPLCVARCGPEKVGGNGGRGKVDPPGGDGSARLPGIGRGLAAGVAGFGAPMIGLRQAWPSSPPG